MPLSPLTGAATTTAKVGDVNALITALNAELALLASKADVVAVNERVANLAATLTARLDQISAGLTALENEPDPVLPPDLSERVAALEDRPAPVIPPDLTTRVEALEALVQRVPAENPAPRTTEAGTPGKPAGLDPDEVALVYNRAVLYYHDIEMYADRLSETKWRLYASLNFIVISPAIWTYDEIVEGPPEEVYEHAQRRLMELAELKPSHDAVHERVREMSEGQA